jgi:hypothetical protein
MPAPPQFCGWELPPGAVGKFYKNLTKSGLFLILSCSWLLHSRLAVPRSAGTGSASIRRTMHLANRVPEDSRSEKAGREGVLDPSAIRLHQQPLQPRQRTTVHPLQQYTLPQAARLAAYHAQQGSIHERFG